MTNRAVSGVLFLLFTLAFVAPAGAQTLTADEKELAAYTLAMPTITKMAAALRTVSQLAAQDPKAQELAKIRADIDALEKKKDELSEAEEQKLEKLREQADALEQEQDRSEGTGDAKTIDEMEARINRHPGAAAALAKEGLPAREFAKCTLALVQAAMVKGFSQGKVDMAKLPAGINPANVKFVEEHEKELAELQKEMQGLSKK